ncbi:MAG: 30S ribosomal protein S3 [Nanoarchaeota archaeon]|nr:30S ribosomal protein S3 [Nanoarchaeota archaeon]MBU1704086.1 30S ribosomal protein S3 [Nanoarchaeota archaeon]
MIERKFVAQKIKELQIEEFISEKMKNIGHSGTKMQKTPLGEKIVIYASRPGLVVGKKGQNIRELTKILKEKFNLENPQIEISEVENIDLDANIVAEKIADSIERFGTSKFKAIGHKVMSSVMGAGALGIEILISGKIPSSRAKRWRFYTGYLKKCGDIALTGVLTAQKKATIKTGTVGIQVKIMPPDIELPDRIKLKKEIEEVVEEVKEEPKKKRSKTKDKPEKEEETEDILKEIEEIEDDQN